jgi:hypothetical protein
VRLAGASLTGLLLAHLQLSGLALVAVGAEPVPAGRPLALRLHLRAEPGHERHGLRIDGGGAIAVLSLDAGAGEAVLPLPTHQRGWLQPPRLKISSTRPLGLVRAWSWVWPDVPVLVYPAPESGGPPLPEGAGSATRARLHPAGAAQVVDVVAGRSPGSLRRAATACWCASTSSRWAPTSTWTGTSSPASATRTGSGGWRAGSTRPSARTAATACSCRGSRRWAPIAAAPIAMPACGRWR